MKQFLIALLGSVVFFSACQEDVIEAKLGESDSLRVVDSISAPIIRLVDSKVPTTLKFGFSVAAHQINDTVYYLMLPDSTAAPTTNELIIHPSASELPMEGSYFRSTFRSGLSGQTKYAVYATIKSRSAWSKVVSLTMNTGKDSDNASSGNLPDKPGGNGPETPPAETPLAEAPPAEEPPAEEPPAEEPPPGENPPTTSPQDTTTAPVLEPRGTPQRNVISLAVLVNGEQIDGTLHYLYFAEDKNPETLTPQEVVDHRLTETVPMSGATIRKFNFPATSQTKYYIYGVLQVGDKLSRVVLIERSTV